MRSKSTRFLRVLSSCPDGNDVDENLPKRSHTSLRDGRTARERQRTKELATAKLLRLTAASLQHSLTSDIRGDEKLAEPVRRGRKSVSRYDREGEKRKKTNFLSESVPRTSWLSNGILVM